METINLQDYTYHLPTQNIAYYPLEQRDESKLLYYNKGNIRHHVFHQLADLLPKDALLFFNNTKVIPARLLFAKDTGAVIEIFLLNPIEPSSLLSDVMQAVVSCTWKCTIGNLKRWKSGQLLSRTIGETTLTAQLEDRETGRVTFSWNTHDSFASVITSLGETPLPPYIQRKAEEGDKKRYQTVYSRQEGAVAAPTAGLHFTEEVFQRLEATGIECDFLTLHVSAGTFQPIKTEDASEHTMHNEQLIISRTNVENLLKSDKRIIAVGTTSMRTLESLYWYGVRLLEDPNAIFTIGQKDPYQPDKDFPSSFTALSAVADYMDRNQLTQIIGNTSIYILPGYEFKVCKGLITNFHQPGSTLILLVAAFVGKKWREIYNEALAHQYRFLSYGDSSLLLP